MEVLIRRPTSPADRQGRKALFRLMSNMNDNGVSLDTGNAPFNIVDVVLVRFLAASGSESDSQQAPRVKV
jgi:hypothetical protein